MKRIILPSLLSIALSISATFNITAQTLLGGVGDTNNIILWLDASTLNLNDGDPVSTWPDISTKNNDAVQLNPSNQARLKIDGIKKSVQFDGTNDFYDFSNNITTSGLTAFIVTKRDASLNSQSSIISLSKHYIYTQSNYIRGLYANLIKHAIPFPNDMFSQFSLQTGSNSTSDDLNITSTLSSKNFTRGTFFSNTHSTLGAVKSQNGLGSYLKFFNGEIAEVILFNEPLNSAKRNIISEYLSIKHNISSFEDLYSYESSHSSSFIGIGQESDGNQTIANDGNKLTLESIGSMSNGEYLMVAHNDSGYASNSNVPSGFTNRWEQTWRVGETGDVGDVKITLKTLSTELVSGSGTIVLLVDNDGNFTNGGSRFYPISSSSVSADAIPELTFEFSGLNLNDGEVFTLARKSAGIESTASGNWSTASTWSCNCVPSETDEVTILNGHTVDVDQNSNAFNLTVNGNLGFTGIDSLFIKNTLTLNSSLNLSNGTIVTNNSTEEQTFFNNSGSTVNFNNLMVNNPGGLFLTNGNWSLSGSLRVSAGGLNVSGANSFTLISNASTTAEILPSIDDAFTGEFTVQRYISNRRANYSNHGAPISDATVADLDDESGIIISGVNGNDGNILFPDNSIFYSMFFYDPPNNQHQAITSTTTPLPSGKGFELYLLSTPSNFSGATIDYKGTPTNGNISQLVDWQWNLVGNPYQAHLDFDKVERDRSIRQWYQIYNSTTGTYDYYDGATTPDIAPGQGFWIYCSANWGPTLTFKEEDKVSSNSSTFKRRKYIDPYFSLNISNQENPFSHKMRLSFDAFATEEMNESDVTLIPSPIKEAPAIYSKAVNSEEELIVNSLNPTEESQLVPVSIYAGVEGEYEISADNLDALYENYSCVYLKDNETEVAIDLMVEPKYSFEAAQGKSDRFQLILSNSYEECQALLKEGEFVQNFDQKLSLRNAYENWYVDYTLGKEVTQLEIRVYNMSGQEVKAPMSFEANGAGTYPLQHLNDLEGIYLIQIVGEDIFLNKQVRL